MVILLSLFSKLYTNDFESCFESFSLLFQLSLNSLLLHERMFDKCSDVQKKIQKYCTYTFKYLPEGINILFMVHVFWEICKFCMQCEHFPISRVVHLQQNICHMHFLYLYML